MLRIINYVIAIWHKDNDVKVYRRSKGRKIYTLSWKKSKVYHLNGDEHQNDEIF